MLMADERHDFVRTYYSELQEADFPRLEIIYEDMVAESKRMFTPGIQVAYQAFLDLRYIGQEFTLPVPTTPEQLAAGDRAAVRTAFDALHEQRYAHHAADEPAEIVNIHLVALGRRSKLTLPSLENKQAVAPKELRPVYFDDGGPAIDCPVYKRDELPPGATFPGPALVSEYGSTTVVFPGDHLAVAGTGELVISVGRA
jgi:N-methylhydantoinase A